MNTNPTQHRRTRYERVKSLLSQAIEDGLTDKMMQAQHILDRIYSSRCDKMQKRTEYLTRLRQDTTSC
jgi:hypothetical protein